MTEIATNEQTDGQAGEQADEQADHQPAEIEEVEVTVEKLIDGGDGLARLDGFALFVPRSAPGDRLRVRVVERKSGYGRAEIVEILSAGEGRREPPCPHFARCGGCDLQHLEEDVQLAAKARAVRETLRRLGGVETLPKVTVVPGRPWGYRLRAQLHVEDGEIDPRVGYFAQGSHELEPIDQCPVLVPELEGVLGGLPRSLREVPHRRIDLTAGDGERWTVSPPVEGLPRGEVTTRVGDFAYAYDARCFFQSHRQLIPALVEHALGPETGEEKGTAYDLFAGVGLFSLPLAARYDRVIAVEGDRIANRFAKRNARANGIKNLTVERRSVESFIRMLPPRRPLVLVDPPRLGLTHPLRRALVDRRPRRLTYVSCHAATLARDLKQLARGFRIESLALLDMFPQTGHMETVVRMVDRDAK